MTNKKMYIIVVTMALLAIIGLIYLTKYPVLTDGFDFKNFGQGKLGANIGAKEYWEVEINQTLSLSVIEERGGPDRIVENLTDQISETLSPIHAEQVEYSVKYGEKTKEGVDLTTEFRGRDPQIIGSVMYDDLGELFNLLAGPISLNISGETKVGTPLHLSLLTNSSTGYGWYVTEGTEVATKENEKYWTEWEVHPGVPEIQSLDFIFDVSGNVEFTIDYTRPWENPSSWQNTRIDISQSDFIDIFDLIPTGPNLGGADPYAVAEYESEHKWDSGGLPKTYNWVTTDNRKNRSLDLVIGDQMGCGSCWAFATTGITEAAFQVQNHTGSYDFSEQYLVSCNTPGVRCGGWNYYDGIGYHIDVNGLGNNQPGAVYESDMPYDPSNFMCKTVANHNKKVASRYWVTDDPTTSDSLAVVSELKAAIREYGPIAVNVCGRGTFQLYTGGVFDANNCQILTHAVLLVGWDDNDEAWIMKNSWGSNWGENGYMRIKWGTNRIGAWAMYAIVP